MKQTGTEMCNENLIHSHEFGRTSNYTCLYFIAYVTVESPVTKFYRCVLARTLAIFFILNVLGVPSRNSLH
jgi:hypothetical protein